jgi:apolipoprotein N-acyltransferase
MDAFETFVWATNTEATAVISPALLVVKRIRPAKRVFVPLPR